MIANAVRLPARRITRPLFSGVAGVVVAALVMVVAPMPALATTGVAEPSLVAVQAPAFTVPDTSVPVVETLLGRGGPLGLDATGGVTLGDAREGHEAALVRITALEPVADVTVLTGATGAPVLFGPASHTTSTVVLLPIADGAVSLWSDHETPIRVEVLAYFGGSLASPGATKAVAEPVRRADTSIGLGATSLGRGELWIGLTGEGGVPSTGVRSAYVTLDVTLAESDQLQLSDGQSIDLPAGRSVVTTVVTLDEQGGIHANLRGATEAISFTADVHGWVVEAPLDARNANLVGSYVSTTELNGRLPVQLRAGAKGTPLHLADSRDASHALVLVEGSAMSAPSAATTVQHGEIPTGRATGAAVDSSRGVVPQLALVPVAEEYGSFSLRQGAIELTVQPLGSFLGDASRERDQEPELTIDSHRDGDDVDISATGFFTLSGSAIPGANSIDRIEMYAFVDPAVTLDPQVDLDAPVGADGSRHIGNAQLSYDDNHVTWSFDAAAPTDGTYTYSARLIHRGDPGSQYVAQSVELHVNVAAPGEEVVSPDARVMNMESVEFAVDPADERKVIFGEDPQLLPDDILVGGATAATPEGFLGRVSAINNVNGSWIIDTVEVQIEELIFQADIDETIDYVDGQGQDGEPIVVTSAEETTADPESLYSGTYAVADDQGVFGEDVDLETVEAAPFAPGDPGAELFTGEDVDLDLGLDDFEQQIQDDVQLQCITLEDDPQEPRGPDIDEDGNWVTPDGDSVPGGDPCVQQLRAELNRTWSVGTDATLLLEVKNGKLLVKDQSNKPEQTQVAEKKSAFGNKFGIAVKASGQASATLKFKLDVKFKFAFKPSNAVKVQEFMVKVETDLKAQASLSMYVETNWKLDLTKKLGEVNLPTLTFMIGVVPIVILNDFEIALSIDAGIKAQVDFPVIGVSRHDEFGFTYSSGEGIKRIKNPGKTTFVNSFAQEVDDQTQVKLSGWISVGPEVTFNSRIYKFAGPAMSLGAGAGIRAELKTKVDETSPVKAKIEIFLGGGLKGKAKLTLLRWELLNVTIFKIEWETVLWSGEWDVKKAKPGQ